ncbi:MAG: M14 family metallopeptidase, partial [Chitinophagaceae bacterium]
MKKILFFAFMLTAAMACAQPLSYYLPASLSYDANIPKPAAVVGHEVGEWHITHDRLVQYMRAIDAASNRVSLEVTGTTYEGRQQLALFITSPENHARLEQIRQNHLLLSNPDRSESVNTADMPLVVWIGCSIHGNEPSGANMSLLLAYHLAAAQGAQIDELLRNTVIILDPSFNPDGLNRFASWVNTHKSATAVTDPNAREFNEVWPGGRTNHYYFDLNRDWLPAQQPESRNRLQVFHRWRPNVLTDHHEMGSNATFFFQPGVPSRVNPNTPKKNQALTAAIATYHAKYLDSIGSMYFTKEGYDDFYYGKGSTFPDIHGSIGILFEQASSRGHAQQTQNGVLSFPFTIRNQFVTALSTLEAGRALRKELLDYQRSFFINARSEAAAAPVKAYVFGDAYDASRNHLFLEMLQRHQIQVYEAKQNIDADGKRFNAGSAWVVPTAQPQYKLVKTIFEKTFQYEDSLFYDITTWTFPLAMGLPYAELKAIQPNILGAAVTVTEAPLGKINGAMSKYAYAFEWDDFYAPKLLYALQSKGVQLKVATQLFESITAAGKRRFNYGAILIPVQQQAHSPEVLYRYIESAVAETGVEVFSISSGLSATGVDLGSGSFQNVRKPSIMLMGGNGTSSNDCGEIWHLLDQRMRIPASMVEVERLSAVNISTYNVVIMPEGNYNNIEKAEVEKLRSWVSNGGTLIAIEGAGKWLSSAGVTKTVYRNAQSRADSNALYPYYLRTDEMRAKE